MDWGAAQTWRIRTDGANLDVWLNVNNSGSWEQMFSPGGNGQGLLASLAYGAVGLAGFRP